MTQAKIMIFTVESKRKNERKRSPTFAPAPMPKRRFHSVALPLFVPIRITGNHFEHYVCESPE